MDKEELLKEELLKKIESTSNRIIPKYYKDEEETVGTPSTPKIVKKIFDPAQEKIPENKVIDIIEIRENLEKDSKNTVNKTFSKWNLFKHNTDSKIRSTVRLNRTIRIMIKADTIIYPIDIPIEGKTVLYSGRRYKLDGYEHRIYELQGLQCIFVDVNDARPLDLSHQYTNPAYDAREFGSLFDSKAIQDLMSGSINEQKINNIYILVIIGIGLTALIAAMMWGLIKPDWQKIIDGLQFASQTAQTIVQTSGNEPAQIITGR